MNSFSWEEYPSVAPLVQLIRSKQDNNISLACYLLNTAIEPFKSKWCPFLKGNSLYDYMLLSIVIEILIERCHLAVRPTKKTLEVETCGGNYITVYLEFSFTSFYSHRQVKKLKNVSSEELITLGHAILKNPESCLDFVDVLLHQDLPANLKYKIY